MQQEPEIVTGIYFTGQFSPAEYTHRARPDQRKSVAFEPQHASFAQSRYVYVGVDGNVLFDTLLARFSRMALRVCVEVVGVDLERDQSGGMKRGGLDDLSLIHI